MNSELMALADRCEAATSPDRRLDAEIAHTLCWRWDDWEEGDLKVEDRPLETFIDRVLNSYNSIFRHCPSYTASLDAAMALVPDGYKPMLCQQIDDDRWRANLWFGKAQGVGFCYAATPALALTAACLRAIVSQEKPA